MAAMESKLIIPKIKSVFLALILHTLQHLSPCNKVCNGKDLLHMEESASKLQDNNGTIRHSD